MMERDTFARRLQSGAEVFCHELFYPMMQARDSVEIRADVELGGTDQTFNNLMGRDFQRAAGQDPQVVMVMPLLVGTDGKEKMSKSLGNYIAVTDPPAEMFAKTMSIPDELMRNYWTLLTREQTERVDDSVMPRKPIPVMARSRWARPIVDQVPRCRVQPPSPRRMSFSASTARARPACPTRFADAAASRPTCSATGMIAAADLPS
jgi:tyrosyl-tRNA synthetase